MKLKIKVRRINNLLPLPSFITKGDYVDLRCSKTTHLEAPTIVAIKDSNNKSSKRVHFDYQLIPLGIAMKLPKGFVANVMPRSSTYKNSKIIMSNSIGIIDSSYQGNNDEWKFPAVAFTETTISEGERICQFTIQLSPKATFWQKLKWLLSSGIEFVEVNSLSDINRGGFGTSGIN